jgi:stage II sporulation protein R
MRRQLSIHKSIHKNIHKSVQKFIQKSIPVLIYMIPILLICSVFFTQTISPITFAKETLHTNGQIQTNQAENVDPDEDTALTDGIIPSDALRLRIIANSDNPKDQQLKRDVRDSIISVVGKKLDGVTDKQQAETILKDSVPELDKIAQQVIHREGFTYPTQTEVGIVPFPTKMYGDQVYPAGNYEALRIIIGAGKGQNWWCVLFPPLCFVDLANGDAVPNKKDFPDTEKQVSKQTKSEEHARDTKHSQTAQSADGNNNTPSSAGTIQVRFAVVDYGKKFVAGFIHALSKLFHNLFA